jgi:hypothetical protein
MRTRGIVAAMVVCAASMGCNSGFIDAIGRNFTLLPLQSLDEYHMRCRNHRLAEEAWKMLRRGAPREFSEDFGAGFVAGYADYLNNGGNGDPPAVPPFCYRTVRYQTVEGVEAINQWYEGWKHGSLMAKATGLREIEVVQLSAPPINAIEPAWRQMNAQTSSSQPPTALPNTEPLPLPRTLPNN